MRRTVFSRETSQGAPNTTWNYYLVFLCGCYPPQTQLHFDSGKSDQYVLYKIIIIYYLSSAVSRLSAMQNVEKDKNLWILDQKGKERQIAFQSVPRANAFLSVWCCKYEHHTQILQDHRVWREEPEGLISHFWFCVLYVCVMFLPASLLWGEFSAW